MNLETLEDRVVPSATTVDVFQSIDVLTTPATSTSDSTDSSAGTAGSPETTEAVATGAGTAETTTTATSSTIVITDTVESIIVESTVADISTSSQSNRTSFAADSSGDKTSEVPHEHEEPVTYVPAQGSLVTVGAFLTGPTAGDPLAIATDYLTTHAADLGLSAADIASFTVTSSYTSEPSGTTHIYLQQTYNGIPVANALLNTSVTSAGEIVSVYSTFQAGLGTPSETPPTVSLSAVDALTSVLDDLELTLQGSITVLSASDDLRQSTVLQSSELSRDDIPAKLQYVVTADGVKLGWQFILRTPDGDHWYDVTVDGNDGTLIAKNDWVSHASYRALKLPTEHVQDTGGFVVHTNPEDATASPFGWHDTNGASGAESTLTIGNNVDAHLDRNGDDNPDAGSRPDGGAGLDFSTFVFDAAQAPSVTVNQNAAVVNLFYMNNVIHDITYKYGFTEAAFNFQENNYGRGGTASDGVIAQAQDNATGGDTDNANFFTPPDGQNPYMQMYEFTYTTPRRDSDLDNGIIIHEYTHGISNRLTGGGTANGLQNTQSRGMGEGWGDWMALMFTQRPTDTQNQQYGMGTYVLGEGPTGAGIRTQRYTFDMPLNSKTLGAYNSSQQYHTVGEIWASTLWDINWMLSNKYGWDADLYTGYSAGAAAGTPAAAGNKLALQLVLDGMKLQPSNPTFTQARDAIIQADVALTGGKNVADLWVAFARRGFGLSASSGANSNSTSVVEAFDLPTTAKVTENFDSVTSPTLPTNWTSLSQSGSSSWVTTTSGAFNSPNAVFIANAATTSDTHLLSRNFTYIADNNQLAFKNTYNLENGADFGSLDISIEGGAFVDIITAGGSFISGGYNSGSGWTGTSPGTVDTLIQLPASGYGNIVQFRWQLTTNASGAATGWTIDNVYLNTPDKPDFGDAPDTYGTTIGSNGARHTATGPTLGASRDGETDAATPLNGTGDDSTGSDDEDGVSQGMLTPGQNGTFTINASGASFLNAWVDFDGNGSFSGAEQIATNVALVAGNNTLNVAVPGSSTLGTHYARFRLTSATVASPSPTGLLPDGEVEDYALSFSTGTLAEKFDSVTAPTLPTGWTTTSSGAGGANWVTSATSSFSAPNNAFVPDNNNIGDNQLISPVFTYTTGAQLTFRHSFNTEDTYDGGVLEISIDGAAFVDVTSVGGSFATGGYTDTISSSFGNPIGGRQAWAGNSGGYILTTVNMPNSGAGKAIQLRWREGTDNDVAGVGWRIDDISLNQPDLVATASNSVGGIASLGTPFTWTIHVANNGPVAATFTTGQTIVLDNLPNLNMTYGTPSVTNQTGITGTINSGIASNDLTATANGTVTIAAGGSFDLVFTATPTGSGSFTNPRSGGMLKVDPNSVLVESNEGNNTASDSVTVGSTTTVTLSGGNVTVTDVQGSLANNFTISRSGGNILINDSAFGLVAGVGVTQVDGNTVSILASSITGSITVDAQGGADTLNVDYSGGDIAKTINFNGGTPTSGSGDKIVLLKGSSSGLFNTITHQFTNNSDGSIALDPDGGSTSNATIINYTGLEPISDNLDAPNRIFNYNFGAETITVSDITDLGGTQMRIDSNVGGESVDFAVPTGSITINAGTGDDVVTIATVDSVFGGNLTINGGTGNDTVNLNADISFASGMNLDVNLQDDDATPGADAISLGVNANLLLVGTGSATLKASKNVALASGSSVVTQHGNLTVEANQQGTASTGNFVGVNVNNGLLQATGTGQVTVLGKGGNDAGGSQVGVQVLGGGDIVGGLTGTLTVQGTGGAGSGAGNVGVFVQGAGSTISSGGAAVAITAASGNTSSEAIRLDSAALIMSGGTANLSIAADSLNIVDGASTIQAGTAGTATATIVERTSTTQINLGGADVLSGSLTLGLTDAELDRVTAGTLNIGDASAGTITVSADLTQPGKNLTLTTGAGVTGSGDIVNGSATATTVTINQAGNSTYSGRFGGPSGGTANDKNLAIVKQGAGTLSLTGASNYSGTTTLSAGIVNANSSSALGEATAGNTLIFAGGSLQAGGTINSPSTRPVNLQSTGTIDTNGNAVTIAGNISGAEGLVKNGAGTLTLSFASSGFGGVGKSVTVNAGTLSVSGDGSLGNANNSVAISNSTLQTTGVVNSARAIAINTATIETQSATTLSGQITGSGGLNKTGASTLTLSGNTNNYTGITTVSNGTVIVRADNALGATGGANGTIVAAGNRLQFENNAVSSETITVQGGTLAAVGGTNSTLNGTVTLSTSTATIEVDGASANTRLNIAGQLTGTQGFNVSQGTASSGRLTLSNNTNDYAGATSVGAGASLLLGANNVIPDGAGKGNVAVAGTLDLNGFSDTINGLAGGGTIDNTVVGGPFTLTVGGNDQSGTFGGTIKNTAGTLALAKTGTGTITLGGASTYGGTTTVSAGTLLVNNSTGSGTGSGAVTVQNTATLGGTGSISGAVTVNNGGTLAPGSSPGILDTGATTLNAGSNLNIELNGTTVDTQYDQVNVTGAVSLNDANLNITLGYTPALGDSFTIINNDGTDLVTGTLKVGGTNVPDGGGFFVSGLRFVIDYTSGSNSNDVTITRANLPTHTTELSLSSGNLVINDIAVGGQTDTLTIQSDTTNSKFIISDPNRILGATGVPGVTISIDQHTAEVPFASVTGSQILFNTLDGADSLTVDLSLGNFSKAIVYTGGNPTSALGDSLTLTGGGTFATVTHNFTDASSGTVAVTGNSTITYTGLEPITDALAATDRVFNFNGGAETITVTDGAGATSTIDSTLGESVNFTNPTGTLTINAGSGDDTVTITSMDAAFNASLTINGDAGDDTVNVNGSINFATAKNLDLDLQNDSATPGADTINIVGNQSLSGTGAATLKASKNILVTGSVTTVNGNLTVEANQQATATTGVFVGVQVNGGTLQSNGTGQVSVLGRGGSAIALPQSGVLITLGGDIIGGTTGTLNVQGTGGSGTSSQNTGIVVSGAGSSITTAGANIALTGIEGNSNSFGILSSGLIASGSSATVSITANSMDLAAGTIVAGLSTPSTATFVQRTDGTKISLGNADILSGSPLTLGLTDTELDTITAGTVVIGSANSGAMTIDASVDRSSSTNIELRTGSSISNPGGSLNTGGGTLLLAPGTNVQPTGVGVDFTASAVSFTSGTDLQIAMNGATVDSGYSQLNVAGSVNLSGVDLVFNGSFIPGNGDSFTVVNNDGSDLIGGSFTGLLEGTGLFINGVPKTLTYVGGTGNDVVLSTGNFAPNITTHPLSTTVTAGQTVVLTANADANPTPSVQWQVKVGAGSFTDINGATSTSLVLSNVAASLNGNQYRAIFSNSFSSTVHTATTTVATLTVNAAPTVTGNPSNQTIHVGQVTTTFTASATDGFPTPTSVQWQVSTNGGGTFTNLTNSAPYSGVDTTTLTLTNAGSNLNGYQYRAVFSNTAGLTAATTAATLNVSYALNSTVTVNHGGVANIDLGSLIASPVGQVTYSVSVTDPLGTLQSQYNFVSVDGYFNYRGQNEKYLYSYANGGWYVLLSNGQLKAWNGAIATSPLVTTLSTSVYDNPTLLTSNTGVPIATSGTNPLYDLKLKYGLVNAASYFNYRGANEYYLQSSNNSNSAHGGFYLLLANNTLVAWDGVSVSTSPIVADLSSYGNVYGTPSLLTNASLATTPSVVTQTNGNILSLTLGAGFDRSITVTVTATDSVQSTTQTFTLTVNDAAPTLPAIGNVTVGHNSGATSFGLGATDVGDPSTLIYSISVSNPLFDVKSIYGLTTADAYFNYRNAGERYFFSSNGSNASQGGVYVLASTGLLYAWDGISLSSTFATTAVADLSAYGVYANPALLYNAESAVTVARNQGPLYDVQSQFGLTTADMYFNYRGAGERYFQSSNGSNAASGGFFILMPDGKLYAWNGISIGSSTSVPALADLSAYNVYLNPSLLYQAQATFVNDSLYQLKSKYGLVYAEQYTNYRGMQEKYFYSGNGSNAANGGYYVLSQTGFLYAWNGNINTVFLQTPVGNPGVGVYNNTALLYAASGRTAAVAATVNGAGQVTLTPNAGFAGTVKVTVSVSDGAKKSTQSFLYTVTDAAPTLPVINNVTGISSNGGTTSAISLGATDTDPGDSTLQYAASVSNNPLYLLKTQYGLSNVEVFYNLSGNGEKYFLSSNGSNPYGGGYFVLTSDNKLYAWNGTYASTIATTALADFTTSYYGNVDVYADTSLLYGATATANLSSITWSFTSGSLNIIWPTSFTGKFLMTVYISDGVSETQRTFLVTVS